MTDNQKNFCKDFIDLMKKYNIKEMYVDRLYLINFVSNGIKFTIDEYDTRNGVEIFDNWDYFRFKG